MRLTRLVMHGFRSYREPVEVRFEPGVNVFLGRNEAGKTGILLAVQAALYAPRTAAERESLVADGSDACQLALEYEMPDGREFRVCRDLVGHKGSIAECREGTWLTLATAVGDIAQVVREHTGCDEALFRATLLVRHEAVEVADADDLTRSLSERIELLVSGSPGGISAARAVKKLETHVKELSGPRAGLIMAAATRLREAESVLASATSAVRRLADGMPRLEELSERSELLEKELADAEAVLERARRVAGLEPAGPSYRPAGRRSTAPSTLVLSWAASTARRPPLALGLRATDRKRVKAARPPRPFQRRGKVVVSHRPAGSGRPAGARRNAAAFLGQVLLLGVCLGVVRGGASSQLASVPPGSRGGPGMGRPPSRRTTSKPSVRPGRQRRRRDLAEGAARSLDQRPEAELAAERSRIGRDLEETLAALGEASIHRLEPAELARREVRAQQLPALIRAAAEARIRCEVELQSLENAAASIAELEDEVDVAKRQVERLQLRLEAMRMAREELDAAIGDIRQGVGPELAAEASRALAGVAPGYSVALAVGTGLAFEPAGPGGQPLGNRQLSDGTVDQFHFAVRGALANVLLGDLRPPLLLDDPFRYADADRRTALHAMLAGIAAERQVLYFTVEDPDPLPVTHRLPVVASRVTSE